MVGRFALPLVAVLTLDASPAEMGLLRIADTLPAIAFGLFAGVWVDRQRRRPIMGDELDDSPVIDAAS